MKSLFDAVGQYGNLDEAFECDDFNISDDLRENAFAKAVYQAFERRSWLPSDNLKEVYRKVLIDWDVYQVSQQELDDMAKDYPDYIDGISAGDWVVSDSEVVWSYERFDLEKSDDDDDNVFEYVLEEFLDIVKKLREENLETSG